MTANSTQSDRTARESEAWQLLARLWFSHKPVMMSICRDFDLFPPQIMVLQTLDRPKPMRQVAEYMSCNSSNLTGITDRLEDRDLVERTADPSDRRVKLLVLTPEGEKLREQVVARLNHPPESMAALTDEDLKQLSAILGKLGDSGPVA
ncbi:MAG TPA: MarR family transcriptional regulator [Solirubrobacterales bacterium]|nr:MarR family transcriptional regulator [Solirubrobacterales bacterium]